MGDSLSKTPIKVRIAGVGEAEGDFVRIYAPLTVETLLRRLPLEGRAHPIAGGISFIIGIRRGEEKPVRKVDEGTIAYWPRGDALTIFHSAASTYSPVNRVGRLTKNPELFGRITGGTEIRVERVTSG